MISSGCPLDDRLRTTLARMRRFVAGHPVGTDPRATEAAWCLERRICLAVSDLTWDEIETYTATAWPLLRRLTANQRERLRPGPARPDIAEYRGNQGQGHRSPIESRALRCG